MKLGKIVTELTIGFTVCVFLMWAVAFSINVYHIISAVFGG